MGKSKKITYITAFLCMMAVVAALFFFWGNGKRITFCDEVYTYTIVNSRSLIQFTVNDWMSGSNFNDSLTHGADNNFRQMIVNIKGDMVHPPLYYFFMYISSVVAGSNMSVWTGLIVNLLGYLGTACIMFLILKKLFDNPAVSALGAIGLMWTQCMISDAMLIRMYMIYTFFTALFAYANLLISEKKTIANYILLCVAVVGGFMTQYYFLFFVVGFFAFEVIYDIVEKKYWDILKYALTIVAAFIIVTLLWSFWFEAITSNTHSSGVIGNAKEFLSHLGKIFDSYQLVMASVFQKAYKVFMIVVPLLLAAFFIIVKGKENHVIRSCVVRFAGTAFMYAFIVNVLTPGYLSSTRYYYASMMLVMAFFIICVFGIADTLIKSTGGKKTFVLSAVGLGIITLNGILLATGFGVDYYTDKDEYDSVTDILEGYSNIPWVIGGDINWKIETNLMDYSIPDRIIPLNSKGTVEENAFDDVDEFILAECNENDSEFVTRRNLYNYITTVGKEVSVEKIVSRGYVTYYYCRAVDYDENEQQQLVTFMNQSKELLWIVINDDGWYDAEELFPDGEPENIIFIDSETAYDTSGKYSDYNEVVVISSAFGEEIVDTALYYMIGSTGKFYGGDYLGVVDKGKVAVYRCYVIE